EEGAAFLGRSLSLRSLPLRDSAAAVFAGAAWAAFGLSCLVWEDRGDWSRTDALAIAAFAVAAAIVAVAAGGARFGRLGAALRARAPWLVVLGLLLSLWELATAKFAWLPLPFFPPPQA